MIDDAVEMLMHYFYTKNTVAR